jgi:hypothetical protein
MVISPLPWPTIAPPFSVVAEWGLAGVEIGQNIPAET